MKDKIKRYARLLWKYKYLILWAVLVIMFWGRWGESLSISRTSDLCSDFKLSAGRFFGSYSLVCKRVCRIFNLAV